MKRRKFLEIAGVSSVGAFTLPLLSRCTGIPGASKGYGLQIYTLRDLLNEDFAGTLEKVAEIGYDYLEMFNYKDRQYFGNSIEETKQLLSNLGLDIKSSHIGLDLIRNNWEQTVEDAATLEQLYIVCPYLTESDRQSIDDYKRLAELFNKKGEVAKASGIQFAYHNHDFEFKQINGQTPYDLLLSECDEDLVKFEMDLYWVKKAGREPVEYFEKYAHRFSLWHVKDMTDDEEQFFAPVGQGSINWGPIFANADESGMEYFFVEQDASKNGKPLQNIETSLKYLKEKKLA